MKIDNWIAIAAVIIPILYAELKGWCAKRSERASANPATAHPSPSRTLTAILMNPRIPAFLSISSILLAAFLLVTEMIRKGPVTKVTVFSIALDLSVIVYQLLSLNQNSTERHIREVDRFHREAESDIIKTNDALLQIVTFQETLDEQKAKLPR